MSDAFDAVIVGGGPRGVATVLRLAARAVADGAPADGPSLDSAGPARVAIVDAIAVGPGATWDVDQPAAYLNNTQASATTVHPDDSTPMSGPAAEGPDLVAWARQVASCGTHTAGEWVVAEAAALGPDDFPSRRLQGVYFRDQLDAAISSGHVHVEAFHGLAVDLLAEGGLRTVVLEDGRRLTAPTVVLAQGMIQARRGREVTALVEAAARHGLRYVEPGMPAERVMTGLPAGEDVLVRGLGANFFDVIGQLVADWGGRVDPVPGDPRGRLRYHPTGREPRLLVGSRRGIPYRAKPDGGRPVRPFTPRWAGPAFFDALAERADVDFATEVWPVLAREFARVYLEALADHAPAATVPGAAAALDEAPDVAAIDAVLDRAITAPRWSWALEELHRPTRGQAVGEAGWAALVARWVEDELGSLAEPATHPRAAVNGAMGALRRDVARLTALGAFSGASLAGDVLGWFDGDSLALASGPPADRVRLLLALVDAGVVQLLGPATEISVDEAAGCFHAESALTGARADSLVLLETRMSKGRVPETSDPLLRSLLDSGRARVHAVDGVPTHSMEATGAEISESAVTGHNLVAADGSVDPAVVVLGIPAQSTQPGSAIGASPGVPSPLLAGADIAAKQVLARVRTPAGSRADQGARPHD